MTKLDKSEIKKMSKAELARYNQKLYERDAEEVNGIFKNLETPGGTLCFMYKVHPDDDFKSYELKDGERYRIPRGVARHLNNQCYYKEYKPLTGQHGETAMRAAWNDGRLRAEKMQTARKIHRFAFHNLEFMDDDLDMNPVDLVEVTVSP